MYCGSGLATVFRLTCTLRQPNEQHCQFFLGGIKENHVVYLFCKTAYQLMRQSLCGRIRVSQAPERTQSACPSSVRRIWPVVAEKGKMPAVLPLVQGMKKVSRGSNKRFQCIRLLPNGPPASDYLPSIFFWVHAHCIPQTFNQRTKKKAHTKRRTTAHKPIVATNIYRRDKNRAFFSLQGQRRTQLRAHQS